MTAAAHGAAYPGLSNLKAAREHPDGVVIFEGDDGGTIYLTVPARSVVCGEDTLRQLLADIDAICWADNSMHHLCFEALPIGSGVAGGMGGGIVTSSLWLHEAVEKLGIRDDIAAVLAGNLDRLGKRARSLKW